MHITTHTGLVGFFLALSALQVSSAAVLAPDPAAASPSTADPTQTVESRLARLTTAIRQREALLPEGATPPAEKLIALGFANVRGGGGFVNGGGGGFVNANPWRNAWVNGGSFYNYH